MAYQPASVMPLGSNELAVGIRTVNDVYHLIIAFQYVISCLLFSLLIYHCMWQSSEQQELMGSGCTYMLLV